MQALIQRLGLNCLTAPSISFSRASFVALLATSPSDELSFCDMVLYVRNS